MDIVFPAGMFGANSTDDLLCAILRQIGQRYGCDKTGWSDCGKYGCDFEDARFLMHHDCQGCYQEDPNDLEAFGWTDGAIGGCLWCRCHDFDRLLAERFGTVQYDALAQRRYYDPPNFWWKPTDLRITWYKYIGRDMASSRDFTQQELLDIATALLGRTLEQVAEEHARDSRERAEALAGMMRDIGHFGGIHEG